MSFQFTSNPITITGFKQIRKLLPDLTQYSNQEIKKCLKYLYFKQTGQNLPIYSVPQMKLKEFETSKKDVKRGVEKLPEEKFLNFSENMYKEEPKILKQLEEAEEDSKTSATSSLEESFEGGFLREPSKTLYAKKNDKEVSLQSFDFVKVVGKGSFGKVFLVKKKDDGQYFAIKSMRKDTILEYDQLEGTKLEKEIMMQADHPFLVGMNYVFQTEQKIFFVMKFVRGGELFQQLRNSQRFTEDRAKFYAAQIAIALGYLHDRNIIYRDLKPENILIDDDGYLCLADFGLAKILQAGKDRKELAFSFCGTPEYMPPEIITESGHSYTADWWALGILTYEMIVGFPPFYTGAATNNKMYENIKKKQVFFPDPEKHKIKMSDSSKDFIKLLLQKKPENRLGAKEGLKEILNHPWLACYS